MTVDLARLIRAIEAGEMPAGIVRDVAVNPLLDPRGRLPTTRAKYEELRRKGVLL